MTIKYCVEEGVYIDEEAREYEMHQVSEYFDTLDEAKEFAKSIIYVNSWKRGDWRIKKRTIDEKAFTVIDEYVSDFNYWRDVQRYEVAKRNIGLYENELAKLDPTKPKNQRMINLLMEWIANERALLKENAD